MFRFNTLLLAEKKGRIVDVKKKRIEAVYEKFKGKVLSFYAGKIW